MCKLLKENIAQCECLKRLKGETLELIDLYAAELREILCEFEAQHGRVPSGADLVYILCEHHNEDLTIGGNYGSNVK